MAGTCLINHIFACGATCDGVLVLPLLTAHMIAYTEVRMKRYTAHA